MLVPCPKCGKLASGLSCQGCGMTLATPVAPTPAVEPDMVPAAKLDQALEALTAKNLTIDQLSSKVKSLEAENLELSRSHDEMNEAYAQLLSEHSLTKAETKRLMAILNQPPSAPPEEQPRVESNPDEVLTPSVGTVGGIITSVK